MRNAGEDDIGDNSAGMTFVHSKGIPACRTAMLTEEIEAPPTNPNRCMHISLSRLWKEPSSFFEVTRMVDVLTRIRFQGLGRASYSVKGICRQVH